MIEHFAEVGLNDAPFPVSPNFASYFTMERAGNFHLFTARDDSETLRGYSAFILVPDLVYGGCRVAINHAIYLTPAARNGFAVLRFIEFCEQEMRTRGAEIFEYHMWLDHDFGPLLERCGYAEKQVKYQKFTARA